MIPFIILEMSPGCPVKMDLMSSVDETEIVIRILTKNLNK